MRYVRKWLAILAAVAIVANQVPAFADKAKPKILGGVNLTYYCKKTFGTEFKSVLVGATAGNWTCQRNENDRREISVQNACRLQYGRSDLKARAMDWNDPLSWICELVPKSSK